MKKIIVYFFIIVSNICFSSSLRPLTIMIDFPDYSYKDISKLEEDLIHKDSSYSKEFYNNLFFNSSNKKIDASSYFSLESGGTFSLIGSTLDIYGWYTAPEKLQYYGKNYDKTRDTLNSSNLIRFAIDKLIDQYVDFSLYDSDNDNMIDCITIIYAGKGEHFENSMGEDSIWPHYNTISDISRGAFATFNDKKGKTWMINSYFLIPQDVSLDLYIHEIGHYLGLTDLYGKDSTIGFWSVMGDIYCGKDPIGSKVNSIGAYHRDLLSHISEESNKNQLWANEISIELDEIEDKKIDKRLYNSYSKEKDNLIKIELEDYKINIPPTGSNIYYTDNHIGSESSFSFEITLPKGANNVFHIKAFYNTISYRSKAKLYVREAGSIQLKKINPKIISGKDAKDRQWFKAEFDLNNYNGKDIEIIGRIIPPVKEWRKGVAISDLHVVSDGKVIYSGHRGKTNFRGFKISNAMSLHRYLLIEYRVPGATLLDSGLLEPPYELPHPPSLLVWYIDEGYSKKDNLINILPLSPSKISVINNGRVSDYTDNRYLVSTWGGSLYTTDETPYISDDIILFREKSLGQSTYNLIDGIKIRINKEVEEYLDLSIYK